MKKILFIIVSLIILWLFPVSLILTSQEKSTEVEKKPIELFLPKDNILFFKINNIPKIKSDLKGSIYYNGFQKLLAKLLDIKEVSEARNEINESLKQATKLGLRELVKIFTGDVALAIKDINYDNPEKTPIVFVFDTTADTTNIIKTLVTSEGATIEIVEHNENFDIYAIAEESTATEKEGNDSKETKPEKEKKKILYYTFFAPYLIISNHLELLKEGVPRYINNKIPESLLVNKDSSLITCREKDIDTMFYIAVMNILSKASDRVSSSLPENVKPFKGIIMNLLKELSHLRSLAVCVNFSQDRIDAYSHVSYQDGPGKIFGVFNQKDKVSENSLRIIPNDADQFSIFFIDFSSAWKFINELINSALAALRETQPQNPLAIFNPIALIEASLGTDLQKGLFDTLGKEVITVSTYLNQVKGSPVLEGLPLQFSIGTESAFMIKLNDTKTLKETTRKIISTIGNLMNAFGGMLEGGETETGEEGKGVVSPKIEEKIIMDNTCFVLPKEISYICFADQYLLIGTGKIVSSLMERINSKKKEEKTIFNNPDFKTIHGLIPKEYNSISYMSPGGFNNIIKMYSGMLPMMLATFTARSGSIPAGFSKFLLNELPSLLEKMTQKYRIYQASYGISKDDSCFNHSVFLIREIKTKEGSEKEEAPKTEK